jgi:hypothetical protein
MHCPESNAWPAANLAHVSCDLINPRAATRVRLAKSSASGVHIAPKAPEKGGLLPHPAFDRAAGVDRA